MPGPSVKAAGAAMHVLLDQGPQERWQGFTAITGIGWANVGDGTPFCPLLLTIRVAPKTVVFEAKTAADYIKSTIPDKAGFPDIEWTTSFSSIAPSSRPSTRPSTRPSPSSGIPSRLIAHLKKPYCEGTIVLYLRHGQRERRRPRCNGCPCCSLFLTCRPGQHSKHREEVVALGNKAFEDSTTVVETRIGDY